MHGIFHLRSLDNGILISLNIFLCITKNIPRKRKITIDTVVKHFMHMTVLAKRFTVARPRAVRFSLLSARLAVPPTDLGSWQRTSLFMLPKKMHDSIPILQFSSRRICLSCSCGYAQGYFFAGAFLSFWVPPLRASSLYFLVFLSYFIS